MIGVGKTTLIDNLALELNIGKVVETPLGFKYLSRLFTEPERWGFEAQVAFLIGKANGILAKEDMGQPYLVDRSIEEDAKIFYEYFREKHSIDSLTNSTYQELYKLLCCKIPRPTIQIICTIDKETVLNRIETRDKFNSYVEGYVESIFDRYNQYIEKLRGKTNTFMCDALKYDWTKNDTVNIIAADVHKLINGLDGSPNLDLSILREHK